MIFKYYLKNLLTKRDLLYFLVKREIVSRYKQASLGIFWALLQPLILMFLFSVIGIILNIDSEGVPRPVFYFSAVIPWIFFSSSISQASNSIVSNANLVRQVYFPREILPFSKIFVASFDFLISLVLFFFLMIYYKMIPSYMVLYIPLLIFVQLVCMSGFAILFSSLNVAFRDVSIMMGLILQVWLYASPIIYPIKIIPDSKLIFYYINPMAGIIDSYRRVLLHNKPPNFEGLLIGFSVSLFILIITYYFFKKGEKIFADIL